MKSWLSGFLLVALLSVVVTAEAKLEDRGYLYKNKANWVKIVDADAGDSSQVSITHPYNGISAAELEAMLLSIKINRKMVLKKELKTNEVFNTYEARRVASYVVDGLAKASSDQVINFAVIHKRPLFILRNDHISTGNIWMAADGLHIEFTKIFAQIDGDYESATHLNKALRRAKTMRVALEASEGQKLSYNSPMEIILEPNYNFIARVETMSAEDAAAEEAEMRGGKSTAGVTQKSAPATRSAPSSATSNSAERLRRLEDLKKQKLISDAEYQKLRQKILQEL